MATDTYGQGITLPALTDAPNISLPADSMNDILSQAVLRFASASTRAATLVGSLAPVPGQVTYLASEDRYEARMGDGTWQTISPGPWVSLTFASGYSARTGSPAYRIVNGSVELRGTVEKTPSAAFPKGTAFTILTLPTVARPPAYRYFAAATEFASHLYARVEVEPDGDVTVIVPTSTGTAASWVSLDNIRFSLS
ncbi:hypothetical protein PUR59_00970 [Streptomyces sp. SP18ES09]|uniref:hypothetical protein n=1 Tax=Streptomyces sp. SP18ES09 TaxID=3002532 RepID=UPI002E7A8840|nr:hypothetical protein [Streptomyces sp. SP18ES09]MEE1813613.1 hypothetical protein [Streptomyces sp. SP18ES09]